MSIEKPSIPCLSLCTSLLFSEGQQITVPSKGPSYKCMDCHVFPLLNVYHLLKFSMDMLHKARYQFTQVKVISSGNKVELRICLS